jgi:hypothetical protein
MATRGPQPATIRPRAQLPQARLVLGAAAAAFGLFVAFHWIVLPGDKVSLDQKNRRTESVAAREPATSAGSRRNAATTHTSVNRPAARRGAGSAKTAPHTAMPAPARAVKPIVTPPGNKHPGAPAVGDPATSEGGSPPANQSSLPPPPPASPPPPPPPPAALLPQLPQVPQVPIPTVPDLPKPQVPSVPTPPVPTLP